jgi:hypothetical protein
MIRPPQLVSNDEKPNESVFCFWTAGIAQSVVCNASNHTGVICPNGNGCASGTRNLLNPLPQIVLAQQN